MKKINILLIVLFVLMIQLSSNAQAIQYITKGDQTQLFQEKKIVSSKVKNIDAIIEVDDNKTLQSMEGFGFALTQSTI